MRFIFEDQTFSFELLRTTSYATYGGADIGECLMTAYRIKEGDFESWHKEWYTTAKQIHWLAILRWQLANESALGRLILGHQIIIEQLSFSCMGTLKIHGYYPHGRTVGTHLDRLVN
ncbi:hypothetical protein J14TS2_53130 [Bacillus sp. J14TS2]|nr:hypothetical protein J14TS2_53130 [Bacillus sp. J14TS2]